VANNLSRMIRMALCSMMKFSMARKFHKSLKRIHPLISTMISNKSSIRSINPGPLQENLCNPLKIIRLTTENNKISKENPKTMKKPIKN
jgi:hypothetical protein